MIQQPRPVAGGAYPVVPSGRCCDSNPDEFRLPRKVNTDERGAKDVWLGALFYMVLFAQFLCGCVVWSSRLTSAQLSAELSACYVAQGFFSGTFALESIGQYISKYADIFTGCIVLVVAISVAWILFLRTCTAICVYTTILLRCVIMISLGILWIELGAVDAAVFFFLACAAYLGYMFWKRQEILNAIEIFKMAATALVDRPAIVFSSVAFSVVVFGYLFFLFFLIADTFLVGSVQQNYVLVVAGVPVNQTCWFVEDAWASSVRYFVSITWVWCMSTLQLSNMFVVSRNVSLWYFRQEASGITSFVLAYAKSIGTIAGGAIVLTLVEELENNASCPCNCFLFCLWQVFKSYLQAMTRYAISVASISGAGFGPSVNYTFGLIRRHFHQGMVTNTIAVDMTSGFAWIFSLLIGLLGWIWVDESEGQDPFGQGVLAADQDRFFFYLWLIFGVIWVAILYYYRMLGLLVCSMAPDAVTWVFGIGFAMGLFIGLVSSYLFDLICYTVLYAVDAVLTCYCIDKDAGANQSKHFQAIHVVAVLVPGYVAEPVPGQQVAMVIAQPMMQPVMMQPMQGGLNPLQGQPVQQYAVQQQPQYAVQGQPQFAPQPMQGQPQYTPQQPPPYAQLQPQSAQLQPQYSQQPPQQPQYASAPPAGTAI